MRGLSAFFGGFLVLALIAVMAVLIPSADSQTDPLASCVWMDKGDGLNEVCTRPIVFASTPTPVPPTPVPPTPTPIPPTPEPPTPTPTPPAPTGNFVETFDTPASLDRFIWEFEGKSPFNGTYQSWPGDHDEDCGGPTTSRTINPPADSIGMGGDVGNTVYWCREHVMTSMSHKGYVHLDFTPNQSFDQVTSVCWDQNHNDLGRKWTQMTVVSEARFQANNERLSYVNTQFGGDSGPGSDMIDLADDDFQLRLSENKVKVVTGRTTHEVNTSWGGQGVNRAPRYVTCVVDNEDGTVTVAAMRGDDSFAQVVPGALPDGEVRVIWQDVTYNDDKQPGPDPSANTWHWDNIVIEVG